MAVEHYGLSAQRLLSLCAQYTLSCKLNIVKQGLRRACVIVWRGAGENMEDRGQKASCARSHGCIKQGMKYSNMALRLFSKKAAHPERMQGEVLNGSLLLRCMHSGVFL